MSETSQSRLLYVDTLLQRDLRLHMAFDFAGEFLGLQPDMPHRVDRLVGSEFRHRIGIAGNVNVQITDDRPSIALRTTSVPLLAATFRPLAMNTVPDDKAISISLPRKSTDAERIAHGRNAPGNVKSRVLNLELAENLVMRERNAVADTPDWHLILQAAIHDLAAEKVVHNPAPWTARSKPRP